MRLTFFLIYNALFVVAFYGCSPETASNEQDSATQQPVKVDSSSENSALLDVNLKLRNDVDNPKLFEERAKIYFDLGDVESAHADIDRSLEIDSLTADYYVTKAGFYFRQKDYLNAEKVLSKGIAKNPEHLKARLDMANLRLMAGQFPAAMVQINEILRADMYNSRAYYLKGIAYFGLGDTTTAISSLRTAVEQDPEYADAYFQLGLMHHFLKDRLAIDYYQTAIRLDPSNTDSYYNLGMFCQENDEQQLAINAYTDLIKVNPNYREAHFNLGYVHMNYLKLYRQSAQYFTDAIKVSPLYFEAYYNRGYAYELMGDIQRAEVDYKNALSIQPDYTPAARGLERVRLE